MMVGKILCYLYLSGASGNEGIFTQQGLYDELLPADEAKLLKAGE